MPNINKKWFETSLGVDPQVAWVNQDGSVVDVNQLRYRLKSEYQELLGKHIFIQNKALGLDQLFQTGSTPAPLPHHWA